MSEIIRNTIQSLCSKEMEVIRERLKADRSVLVVELEGKNVQSWKEYITEVQSTFRFPSLCFDSVDRYLDWMRDLSWLPEEKFVLIISHFSDFCKKNPAIKKEIMQDLEDIILPFWQDEVNEAVVDGEPKSFMVYLVD